MLASFKMCPREMYLVLTGAGGGRGWVLASWIAFGQYVSLISFRVTLEQMETSVIQLQALRKPVVTVHFNEPNQLRECCLYCGVAVGLVKLLPGYTEVFFFLKRPLLRALE